MSTPFLLQDAIIAELKMLFADYELKGPDGEARQLNVYPQFLPAKSGEDDLAHFPYITVRVLDGGTLSGDDPASCKVGIFVGVYDEDENHQGYKDVLNILSKIELHFFTKRVIDSRYIFQYPYDWAIYDEDKYPYYVGGAQTTWMLPGIRQEVVF